MFFLNKSANNLFFIAAWDQSDKFVKIYITGLKDVSSLPEDSFSKSFAPSSVEVKVLNLAGKNHVFSIKETCEKINPEKSYMKVKTGGSFREAILLINCIFIDLLQTWW